MSYLRNWLNNPQVGMLDLCDRCRDTFIKDELEDLKDLGISWEKFDKSYLVILYNNTYICTLNFYNIEYINVKYLYVWTDIDGKYTNKSMDYVELYMSELAAYLQFFAEQK